MKHYINYGRCLQVFCFNEGCASEPDDELEDDLAELPGLELFELDDFVDPFLFLFDPLALSPLRPFFPFFLLVLDRPLLESLSAASKRLVVT